MKLLLAESSGFGSIRGRILKGWRFLDSCRYHAFEGSLLKHAWYLVDQYDLEASVLCWCLFVGDVSIFGGPGGIGGDGEVGALNAYSWLLRACERSLARFTTAVL